MDSRGMKKQTAEKFVKGCRAGDVRLSTSAEAGR